MKEEQREHREELEGKTAKKSYLDTQLSLLTTCNYNACQEYETALAEYGKKESELQELVDAQKNNMEYLRLAQTVSDLEQELAAIRKEISDVRADMSHQETEYNTNEKDYQIAEENIGQAQTALQEYRLQNGVICDKAIRDYEQYLENGYSGQGGTLKDRPRAERLQREVRDNLKEAQYRYNAVRTAENQLPVTEDSQASYQGRKDKIWMDDRQEI